MSDNVKLDPARLVQDGQELFGIAKSLDTAISVLNSSLGSSGGMAGDDNAAEEFCQGSEGYDALAGPSIDGVRSFSNGLRILDAALNNTARAYDAAQKPGAGLDPASASPSAEDATIDHEKSNPPDALGAGWPGALGEFQEFLEWGLQQLGVVIPTGDEDKLQNASEAWGEFAQSIRSARSQVSSSMTNVGAMTFPQSSSVLSCRQGISTGLQSMITSAEGMRDWIADFRTQLRAMREELGWFLKQMAIEIAAELAIGGLLTVVTAGIGALATAAKVTTTVMRWCVKIAKLIDRLKDFLKGIRGIKGALVRGGLRAAKEGLQAGLASAISTTVVNSARSDEKDYKAQDVGTAFISAFAGGAVASPASRLLGGSGGPGFRPGVRQISGEAGAGAIDGLASSAVESGITGNDFNPISAMVLGSLMGGGLTAGGRGLSAALGNGSGASNGSPATNSGVNPSTDGTPTPGSGNPSSNSNSSGSTSVDTDSSGIPTPGSGDGGSNTSGDGSPIDLGDGGPSTGGSPDGGTPDAGTPDAGTPDAGTPDAGTPDAGTPDAGTPDAGTPDAGTPDAGTPDAGTPDAGTPDVGTPDAGTPDAGTPDAGTPDAGTPDAGTPDAGTPDAGTPDAGTPDAGTPDAGTPDAGTPDAGTPDAGTPEVDADGAPQGGAAAAQGASTSTSTSTSSSSSDADGSEAGSNDADADGATPEESAVAAPEPASDDGVDLSDLSPEAATAMAGAGAAAAAGLLMRPTLPGTAAANGSPSAPGSTTPTGATSDGSAPAAPADGTGSNGSSSDGSTPDGSTPDGAGADGTSGDGSDGSSPDADATPQQSTRTEAEIRQALAEINPNFDPHNPANGYATNCGNTSAILNDFLNGNPTSEAPTGTLDVPEMEARTGLPQTPMTPQQIADSLTAMGPGSHCVVGIDRSSGDGHWFNAFFDGDQVWTLDAQTGDMSPWPPNEPTATNWDASITPENVAPATPSAPSTTTPAAPATAPSTAPDGSTPTTVAPVSTPDGSTPDGSTPDGSTPDGDRAASTNQPGQTPTSPEHASDGTAGAATTFNGYDIPELTPEIRQQLETLAAQNGSPIVANADGSFSMATPVDVTTFEMKNKKHDWVEFQRQVGLQQQGLNALSISEWQHNVLFYDSNGRVARAEQDAGHAQLKTNGVVMTNQAILHGPDQVAGGRPDRFDGAGSLGVNSSLGNQWARRIDGFRYDMRLAVRTIPAALQPHVRLNIQLGAINMRDSGRPVATQATLNAAQPVTSGPGAPASTAPASTSTAPASTTPTSTTPTAPTAPTGTRSSAVPGATSSSDASGGHADGTAEATQPQASEAGITDAPSSESVSTESDAGESDAGVQESTEQESSEQESTEQESTEQESAEQQSTEQQSSEQESTEPEPHGADSTQAETANVVTEPSAVEGDQSDAAEQSGDESDASDSTPDPLAGLCTIEGHGASQAAIDQARLQAEELFDGLSPENRARLLANPVTIDVIPHDKKLTDLAPYAHLATENTFDGRPWSEVRGIQSSENGVRVAIAEEGLIHVPGVPAGYGPGFLAAHEGGHAVQSAALTPEQVVELSTMYAARLAESGAVPYPTVTGDATKFWVEPAWYSAANKEEYFGNSVAAYHEHPYNTDTLSTAQYTKAWLKANDPEMFALLETIYGAKESS